MHEPRLDFRIPISPTPSFFAQVRLFNFALRRLGAAYEKARLTVVVGDRCDIEWVRSQNRWSETHNVVWERVPDEVFDEFGIWGTANWRLSLPAGDAEVIVLSDADTVLLLDIDPILPDLALDAAVIRGHMAHFPPPSGGPDAPDGRSAAFWPWLFGQFGMEPTTRTHRYSMDETQDLPLAPAYFNLGFVAMNPAGLSILGAGIVDAERRINALTQSHMRCQIAVTMIAHKAGADIGAVPAEYNAANDLKHFTHNRLQPADIRVAHYLRLEEIDRSVFPLPENIDAFLSKTLENPVNIEIQKLVRAYRETLEAAADLSAA